MKRIVFYFLLVVLAVSCNDPERVKDRCTWREMVHLLSMREISDGVTGLFHFIPTIHPGYITQYLNQLITGLLEMYPFHWLNLKTHFS